MGAFFTLGHSNHSIEKWLELVRLHTVDVVVDTRSSPYSKYVPQFDRELVQRSLESAGVRYLFLGSELGGRPANQGSARDRNGAIPCSPALRRGRPRSLPPAPAHRPRPQRARPHYAPHSRATAVESDADGCRRIGQAADRGSARTICGTRRGQMEIYSIGFTQKVPASSSAH
jgi:hypothetical protein